MNEAANEKMSSAFAVHLNAFQGNPNSNDKSAILLNLLVKYVLRC